MEEYFDKIATATDVSTAASVTESYAMAHVVPHFRHEVREYIDELDHRDEVISIDPQDEKFSHAWSGNNQTPSGMQISSRYARADILQFVEHLQELRSSETFSKYVEVATSSRGGTSRSVVQLRQLGIVLPWYTVWLLSASSAALRAGFHTSMVRHLTTAAESSRNLDQQSLDEMRSVKLVPCKATGVSCYVPEGGHSLIHACCDTRKWCFLMIGITKGGHEPDQIQCCENDSTETKKEPEFSFAVHPEAGKLVAAGSLTLREELSASAVLIANVLRALREAARTYASFIARLRPMSSHDRLVRTSSQHDSFKTLETNKLQSDATVDASNGPSWRQQRLAISNCLRILLDQQRPLELMLEYILLLFQSSQRTLDPDELRTDSSHDVTARTVKPITKRWVKFTAQRDIESIFHEGGRTLNERDLLNVRELIREAAQESSSIGLALTTQMVNNCVSNIDDIILAGLGTHNWASSTVWNGCRRATSPVLFWYSWMCSLVFDINRCCWHACKQSTKQLKSNGDVAKTLSKIFQQLQSPGSDEADTPSVDSVCDLHDMSARSKTSADGPIMESLEIPTDHVDRTQAWTHEVLGRVLAHSLRRLSSFYSRVSTSHAQVPQKRIDVLYVLASSLSMLVYVHPSSRTLIQTDMLRICSLELLRLLWVLLLCCAPSEITASLLNRCAAHPVTYMDSKREQQCLDDASLQQILETLITLAEVLQLNSRAILSYELSFEDSDSDEQKLRAFDPLAAMDFHNLILNPESPNPEERSLDLHEYLRGPWPGHPVTPDPIKSSGEIFSLSSDPFPWATLLESVGVVESELARNPSIICPFDKSTFLRIIARRPEIQADPFPPIHPMQEHGVQQLINAVQSMYAMSL